MTLLRKLKAQGRALARELSSKGDVAGLRQASAFISEHPQTAITAMEEAVKAASRKNPDEALVEAFAIMFSMGLENLRYAVEAGDEDAAILVEVSLDVLQELVTEDAVHPQLQMRLLNAYVQAGLDPGDELRELLGDSMTEQVGTEPMSLSEILEGFEDIATSLDHDPFAIKEMLDESGQVLPAEYRTRMLEVMAEADNAALRDAAALYLLDSQAEVRVATVHQLGNAMRTGKLSPVTLRRMIAIRNWLPNAERPALDQIIREARRLGVECATWPERRIEKLTATSVDGAGARSLIAVVAEGRKRLITGLLLKESAGITDSWFQPDQSPRKTKEFLAYYEAEVGSRDIGHEFFGTLISHFIAVGRERGGMPTGGFLGFIEAIGMAEWQPRALDDSDLIDALLQGLPSSPLEAGAVDAALKASGDWSESHGFLESWFETGPDIEYAIAAGADCGDRDLVQVLLDEVIEPRRALWIDRLLWTALWLREGADLVSPWIDFFLVGRELHRGRALAEIPLMREIALASIEYTLADE